MKLQQSEPILSLRTEGITKRFPGVLACDHVSMEIRRGEILALVGENGAGKTTLVNMLMGIYAPDEGRIFINDRQVTFRSPADAMALGIGMVHQHYMLVPDLTVWENVALGLQKLSGRRFRLDAAGVRKIIADVSETYGLAVDPEAYIWQLSVGEQQRVELVRALCTGASFLILDEPTSALTPQETQDLIDLLKRMSEKLCIVFISHKLNEVRALCERMVVMRAGKPVYTGDTAGHSAEDIAGMMTGREVDLNYSCRAKETGEDELVIRDLCVRGDRGNLAVDHLNLTVRTGELMGMAGVSGNGQRELAEALMGLRPVESGTAELFGKSLVGKTPKQIVSMGFVGYIPEDRDTEGIVPSMTVRENYVIKDIATPRFSAGGILKLKAIGENAEELGRRYDIRGAGPEAAAGSLSGGNIQKVILAREISRDPKFLLAVYPIRGLDMGAAEFIHHQMLELRDRGVGILLISEELDEVLNMSDRIAVIYNGTVPRILDAEGATRRELGILMAGVGSHE